MTMSGQTCHARPVVVVSEVASKAGTYFEFSGEDSSSRALPLDSLRRKWRRYQ